MTSEMNPPKPIQNQPFYPAAQDSALFCLKACATSFFLAKITAPFIASQSLPTFHKGVKVFTALSILCKIIHVYVEKMLKSLHKKADLEAKFIETVVNMIGYYPHLCVAIIDATTRSTLVHEKGHEITVNYLLKSPSTKIEIFPIIGQAIDFAGEVISFIGKKMPSLSQAPSIGGTTSYSHLGLSTLGAKLGKNQTDVLISAAGPIAEMSLVLADLTVAHLAKDSSGDLNKFLKCAAAIKVADLAFYSVSALWKTNGGHDFHNIWQKGGVHPLVSAGAIIAVPCLYQLFLLKLSNKPDDA